MASSDWGFIVIELVLVFAAFHAVAAAVEELGLAITFRHDPVGFDAF